MTLRIGWPHDVNYQVDAVSHGDAQDVVDANGVAHGTSTRKNRSLDRPAWRRLQSPQ